MAEEPLSNDIAALLNDGRERLLALIRSQVGDATIAEDILQDSLLRALRAAPDLQQRDRFAAWFQRIVRNAVIDHYRRRGTETDALRRVADESEVSVAPDHMAAVCACIEDVLPSMNAGYAELVRRMDLAEEPGQSVAASLGVTRNTLNVRHHRARRQLRARLEALCRLCARHGCLDCSCRGV